MHAYAHIALFLTALPFGLAATYSDLRYMKILNIFSIGLAVAFMIVGLIFLPFDEYLYRLLGGAIVLAITFTVWSLGLMGGGDAKFAAAMALFVSRHDILPFLFILSIITLLVVLIHKIIGRLPFAKPITSTWESWSDSKKFPMGFGFGLAMIYYTAVPVFGLPT